MEGQSTVMMVGRDNSFIAPRPILGGLLDFVVNHALQCLQQITFTLFTIIHVFKHNG